jgi:hypothetical protein
MFSSDAPQNARLALPLWTRFDRFIGVNDTWRKEARQHDNIPALRDHPRYLRRLFILHSPPQQHFLNKCNFNIRRI